MKMQSIGGFLVLMGAGSFVLDFFNMQFKLLAWIDTWGTTTGLIIKIAMIVVGVALLLMSNNSSSEE
ncbi:MAG: hypothetical protein ACPGVN_06715 [Alphaproteobacteria bacterium]